MGRRLGRGREAREPHRRNVAAEEAGPAAASRDVGQVVGPAQARAAGAGQLLAQPLQHQAGGVGPGQVGRNCAPTHGCWVMGRSGEGEGSRENAPAGRETGPCCTLLRVLRKGTQPDSLELGNQPWLTPIVT